MAETLPLQIRPELLQNERTDDPLFNFRYLERHMDVNGEFAPHAEADVLQNLASEYAEAGISEYVVVVEQKFNSQTGRYEALGRSTIEHARIGAESLLPTDKESRNQLERAKVDLVDEMWHNTPETRANMRRNFSSRLISPSPDVQEMSPDVALKRYGYDGRMMIRSQTLSADGETKYMYSASVFGVPVEVAQEFYRRRGVIPDLAAPALGVHRAAESEGLIEGSPEEVIIKTLDELADCTDKPEVKEVIRTQRDNFTRRQSELEEIAHFYAAQEVEFIKELARSRGWMATPAVNETLDRLGPKAKSHLREIIERNRRDDGYFMNDELIPVALSLKQQTTRQRAALAARDGRTMKNLENSIGRTRTWALVESEELLMAAVRDGNYAADDLIRSGNESTLADSGVACQGGCPVALDQFDSRRSMGLAEGLSGEVYLTNEINCPKCPISVLKKRGVLVDSKGKMICLDCSSKNFSTFGSQFQESATRAAQKAAQKRKAREKAIKKKKNEGGEVAYSLFGVRR